MTAAYTCDDCGKQFDSQPAYAGHKAQCGTNDDDANPQTMSDSQQPQTATEAQQTNTAARPVAEAINGFGEMAIEHTGGCRYRVYSWRNGTNTVHHVNTSDCTCTCEDAAYNRDGQEVCDHVAYAVYHAPKERAVGQEAFVNLIGVISEMNDYRNALEQRRQEGEGRDLAEKHPPDDGETDAVDAEQAARDLQAEFDDATTGMDVQASHGVVWINKTPQAPDWTFDAFLSEPEDVQYVHDDHELAGMTPGEYWNNCIEPEDVEQYVAEVL